MKPLVAPTIRMMAISSRRSKVVSLMVLEIMNMDTTNSTAISVRQMTVAIFRTVDEAVGQLRIGVDAADAGNGLDEFHCLALELQLLDLVANRSRRMLGSRS